MTERLKYILSFLLLCGALRAADAPKPKTEQLTLTEATAIQAVIQEQRQIVAEVCAAHKIDIKVCMVDPQARTVSETTPKEEPKK